MNDHIKHRCCVNMSRAMIDKLKAIAKRRHEETGEPSSVSNVVRIACEQFIVRRGEKTN